MVIRPMLTYAALVWWERMWNVDRTAHVMWAANVDSNVDRTACVDFNA